MRVRILAALMLWAAVGMAQQPQATVSERLQTINAKFENGWSIGGTQTPPFTGLTFSIGAYTCFTDTLSKVIGSSATVVLTNNTTNRVYFNGSCALTASTSSWATINEPRRFYEVVTLSSAITTVTDVRGFIGPLGRGSVTSVGSGSGLSGGPIIDIGTLFCVTANTSTFGCVTAADWNIFNNKDKGFTLNGVIYGQGPGNLNVATSAGSPGQALVAGAGGPPIFQGFLGSGCVTVVSTGGTISISGANCAAPDLSIRGGMISGAIASGLGNSTQYLPMAAAAANQNPWPLANAYLSGISTYSTAANQHGIATLTWSLHGGGSSQVSGTDTSMGINPTEIGPYGDANTVINSGGGPPTPIGRFQSYWALGHGPGVPALAEWSAYVIGVQSQPLINMIQGAAISVPLSSTAYMYVTGSASNGTNSGQSATALGQAATPIPYAGTFNSQLSTCLVTNTAQSANNSLVATLRDVTAAADTTLVITVPASGVIGIYCDKVHQPTGIAHHAYTWKLVNNANATSATIVGIFSDYKSAGSENGFITWTTLGNQWTGNKYFSNNTAFASTEASMRMTPPLDINLGAPDCDFFASAGTTVNFDIATDGVDGASLLAVVSGTTGVQTGTAAGVITTAHAFDFNIKPTGTNALNSVVSCTMPFTWN